MFHSHKIINDMIFINDIFIYIYYYFNIIKIDFLSVHIKTDELKKKKKKKKKKKNYF